MKREARSEKLETAKGENGFFFLLLASCFKDSIRRVVLASKIGASKN